MFDILITDATVLLPHAAGVARHQTVGVAEGRIALLRAADSDTDAALEAAADALYERWDGAAGGRIRVAYALRALMSCSEELIRRTADHANERGALIQAHMNEYAAEVNYTLQNQGVRPFEYLERLGGVLSERFLGAHCLMLSEVEKNILVERGVKVCHCPFSNCAKATPETPSLRSRGVIEGLGTDGAAHGGLSLWAEMRLFRSIMNVTHGVPIADPAVMPARAIVNMATENGAAFMGTKGAGTVKLGAVADLITVDLMNPGMYPTGNVVNTLVECAGAADVRDMVVDGQLVMRDREVLTLDEAAIMARATNYQAYLDELADAAARKAEKSGVLA